MYPSVRLEVARRSSAAPAGWLIFELPDRGMPVGIAD